MRTRILKILRQSSGEHISGEEISRQVNISRTAVWKHIQSLKNEGYDIESHARLGYLLCHTPDLLLPEEIQMHLTTQLLGQEIHYFTAIDSTNNEAKKLALAGSPEGTIVIAEEQNLGRGRLARGWFSPKNKGIWLSLVLRPPFSPVDAPKCTLLAAVAVNKAIRKLTGIECGIKWPNDILAGRKKLVGILTEMHAEMDYINYVVIGMGINVNIARQEFPPDIADIATSVMELTGRPVSRVNLLANILAEFETIYQMAKEAGFAPVLDEWRNMSVTLGQMVDVYGISRNFTGKALDIDADGALLVETLQGTVERVLAGDVSIRAKDHASAAAGVISGQ